MHEKNWLYNFLLTITLECFAVGPKAIVKANIARGESFVTVNHLNLI